MLRIAAQYIVVGCLRIAEARSMLKIASALPRLRVSSEQSFNGGTMAHGR